MCCYLSDKTVLVLYCRTSSTGAEKAFVVPPPISIWTAASQSSAARSVFHNELGPVGRRVAGGDTVPAYWG